MNPLKPIKNCLISRPAEVLGNHFYSSHVPGHGNACGPFSGSVISEPS